MLNQSQLTEELVTLFADTLGMSADTLDELYTNIAIRWVEYVKAYLSTATDPLGNKVIPGPSEGTLETVGKLEPYINLDSFMLAYGEKYDYAMVTEDITTTDLTVYGVMTTAELTDLKVLCQHPKDQDALTIMKQHSATGVYTMARLIQEVGLDQFVAESMGKYTKTRITRSQTIGNLTVRGTITETELLLLKTLFTSEEDQIELDNMNTSSVTFKDALIVLFKTAPEQNDPFYFSNGLLDIISTYIKRATLEVFFAPGGVVTSNTIQLIPPPIMYSSVLSIVLQIPSMFPIPKAEAISSSITSVIMSTVTVLIYLPPPPATVPLFVIQKLQ